MARDLQLSIVSILSENGTPVGAGFLIGDREVVTCSHVVTDAMGADASTPEPPSGEVTVAFPFVEPGKGYTAVVRDWLPRGRQGEGDIALLTLSEDAPDEATAARLVSSQDVWGHEFRTFGFPRGQNEGQWASGRLLATQGTRWLQVEDVKSTGTRVRRGFSGAPVWDERLHGVVGMVVTEVTAADEKTAYVIPAAELVSVDDSLLERLVDLEAADDQSTSAGGAYLVGGLQSSVARATAVTGDDTLARLRSPLPPQVPLVGRDGLLHDLAAARASANDAESGGGVVVLTGPRGVGTSALAIALAHRLKDAYADGCVYVDARLADGSSLSTYDLLGRVLRAIGVDDLSIQRRTAQREQLLRVLAARRRLLIVVDNVEDGRPLAGLNSEDGHSLLIITVREAPEQDGVAVPPLELEAARQWLTRSMGAERAQADPKGLRSLATFSGGVPIALHIMAQRLTADPTLAPSAYFRELSDRRLPVSERLGGLDVIWQTLTSEYDLLTPPGQRTFRHLGLIAGSVVQEGAATALAGLDEAEGRVALEDLLHAHLLVPVDDGYHRFAHSLVQLYAHERLAMEEGVAAEAEAKTRLAVWLSAWAEEGAALFAEGAGDSAERRQRILEHLRRIDALEADLVAAAEHLQRYDREMLIDLAVDIAMPSRARPGAVALDRLLHLGLSAAEDAGRSDQALHLQLALGARELLRGDATAAEQRLSPLIQSLGADLSRGAALADGLVHLGVARMRLGALQPAIETLRDAHFAARRAGVVRVEAAAQMHLSMSLAKRRDWSGAEEAAASAVRTARQLGDPSVELAALTAHASICATSARSPFQAKAVADEALDLARRLEDAPAESLALAYSGLALAGQGRWKQGTVLARRGTELARETGNPEVLMTALTTLAQTSIRRSKQLPLVTSLASNLLPGVFGTVAAQAVKIGTAHGLFGTKDALQALNEAAELAGSLGNRGDEAELKSQIAIAIHKANPASPEATLALLAAIELARSVDDPYLLGRALMFHGSSQALRGNFAEALPIYREALEMAKRSGDERLEGSCRRRLSLCIWLFETPKDAVLKVALQQRDRWRSRSGIDDEAAPPPKPPAPADGRMRDRLRIESVREKTADVRQRLPVRAWAGKLARNEPATDEVSE